jgi:genome maintenance exonuclease 1
MKFIDLGLKFPEITQDNSGPIRVYLENDKPTLKYPSVTTILAASQSEETKKILSEWRKRVGDEEADKISTRGKNRGTKVHDLIERHFMGESLPAEIMPHVKGAFSSMKKGIEETLNAICFFEKNLISHELCVGGRVDCVGFSDYKLSIVDFKTSRRMKTPDDCYDYFIQTAIYGLMMNEMLSAQNIPVRIKKLIIIMSVDDYPKPLVFVESLSDWETLALNVIKNYWSKKNDA